MKAPIRFSSRCFIFVTVSALFFLSVVSSNSFADRNDDRERCDYSNQTAGSTLEGVVSQFADGDTIHVNINGRDAKVRLLGIDTPETHFMNQSQGYWGEKAAERTAELIKEGDNVKIEFDREPCDQYGRILGYVWKGDVNINKQLLAEGLAVSYCIAPNEYRSVEFAKVVRESMQNHIGVFSDPDFVPPYLWRLGVEHKKPTRFVGNLFDHKVYRPDSYDLVPVSDRIFFTKFEDIVPPYHFED